jgi:hypothetical protein
MKFKTLFKIFKENLKKFKNSRTTNLHSLTTMKDSLLILLFKTLSIKLPDLIIEKNFSNYHFLSTLTLKLNLSKLNLSLNSGNLLLITLNSIMN